MHRRYPTGDSRAEPGDHSRIWLFGDGRPGRFGYRHLRVTRRRCQASSVAGVTSRCLRSCRGSSRANADRTARSGHEGRGWPTWRRNTATSCRNTSSSAATADCARKDRQPPEQAHHDQLEESEAHDRRSCLTLIFPEPAGQPHSRGSGAVQAPAAWHCTEAYANNRMEADHGEPARRLRPMRGLKTDHSARVIIPAGHAFIQNICRGHYELGVAETVTLRVMAAVDELAWRSDS